MAQRKRKAGRGSVGAAVPPSAPRSALAPPASAPRPASPAPARTGPSTNPRRRAPAPAPGSDEHWITRYSARSEARNAEARSKLVPLAANEHPWPLRIAIALALVLSLGTLVLLLAGVKVGGKAPSVSWLLYVVIMLACGVGMWRHWYQAVLGFLGLLGIAIVILAILLLRFSNLLGLVIPLVLIIAGGWLFYRLVGVLARLQMPQRPTRSV